MKKISVEDRLPEQTYITMRKFKSMPVKAYDKDDNSYIAEFFGGFKRKLFKNVRFEKWYLYGTKQELQNITHWNNINRNVLK